jgi:hypothetical protein
MKDQLAAVTTGSPAADYPYQQHHRQPVMLLAPLCRRLACTRYASA